MITMFLKKELDKFSPNIHEIVYYVNMDQHSGMCDRYSLEELEIPSKQIQEVQPKGFGEVGTLTRDKTVVYVDGVIWFHYDDTVMDAGSARLMRRKGKKTFFVKVSR